jgi:hypothetical protein
MTDPVCVSQGVIPTCFVFRRHNLEIMTHIQVILSEGFHSFPQSFHGNASIDPQSELNQPFLHLVDY